jgi:hypothetical protein
VLFGPQLNGSETEFGNEKARNIPFILEIKKLKLHFKSVYKD